MYFFPAKIDEMSLNVNAVSHQSNATIVVVDFVANLRREKYRYWSV